MKSLTSPSSPSRKLVARVSESSSDSVVSVSSLEYNAGGENGCLQFDSGNQLVPSRPGPFPLVLPAIVFQGLWPLPVSLLLPCELDVFHPVEKESVLQGQWVQMTEGGCACNGTICGPCFSQSLEIVLCLGMCRLIQGC